MEQFLQNYLGICVMVAGGLVALIGILLLVNHGTPAKVIIGVVLGALGLGAVGVGYTLDQSLEVTYTVSDVMQLTDRDNGSNDYRVTLVDDKGISTWIYLDDSTIAAFPKGKEVVMTKRQVNMYRDEKTQ